MNRITSSLSLSAALMLGVAQLSAHPAFAQDTSEKGSAVKEGGAERAPSSSSSPSERAPDSAKSKVQDSDASEGKRKSTGAEKSYKGDDQGKPKSASDQQDPSDKSASDKDRPNSKSADSHDDKASNKQSEGKTDGPRAKKADTGSATKSNDSADGKKSDDGNRNADAHKPNDESKRAASANTSKAEKAKTVDLSGDKKDRVKTSLKTENVKKITNVNVDISVGRRLPRDWEYHNVPPAVIEVVPEYRGYRYAYVEDRYVIVDPDTYEVVYVLDDAGGSGSASVGRSTGESGSSRCAADLTFSQEDRVFIVEKVRSSSATLKIGNLEIGAEVPRDTKVEVFPSEVTSRVSKLDSCRYVMIDNKVAVVDPSDDKIVAIIED